MLFTVLQAASPGLRCRHHWVLTKDLFGVADCQLLAVSPCGGRGYKESEVSFRRVLGFQHMNLREIQTFNLQKWFQSKSHYRVGKYLNPPTEAPEGMKWEEGTWKGKIGTISLNRG